MLLRVRRAGTREAASWLGIRSQPDAIGSLIGLEHEFRVLRGAEPVDFRELIHTLPIDGLRLDPGDRNAYRCRSGLSITADGAEAEFATPPIAVRPGFAHELSRWAERGRAEIERSLPPGVVLEGFSTHLSITMDDAVNDRVCDLFAETFSAGLALLVEGPQSQGIYVRPRPGRIELCGEFVRGERLEAAATFAVGAVLACWRAVTAEARVLPPRLRVNTLPGIERYGIRVRREAYGTDLYSHGRQALLELTDGAQMPAQRHFEAEWICGGGRARQARQPPRSAALVAGFVSGRRALAIEGGASGADVARRARARRHANAFGAVVRPLQRPGFTVGPRSLTWEMAVLRIEGARTAYAAIPRRALAAFEDRLAKGKLDDGLRRALAQPPAGAVLFSRDQAAQPALFDEVGDAAGLVAPERGPAGWTDDEAATADRSRGAKRSSHGGERTGKLAPRRWKALPPYAARPPRQTEAAPDDGPPPIDSEPPPVPAARPTWAAAAAVAIIVVIAIAGAIGAFAAVKSTTAGGPTPTRVPTSHAAAATAEATPTTNATTPAAAGAAATPTTAAAATPTQSPTVAPVAATPVPTAPAKPTDSVAATATPPPPATTTPAATKTPPPTETPQPTATPTPTPTATPTPTPTVVIIAPPPPPPPTAVPTKAPSPVPTAACTPTAVNPCP